MKRNYVQVAQFLEENFPELKGHITGGLKPMPPIGEFLQNVLAFFQFTGLAWMVMGGEKLLRMVGFRNQLPSFYWTVQENPVPMAVFLFLLAPQIIGKFQANGAFEIYLDEKEVFSKLAKGGMPTVDDLIKPLVAAGLEYTGTPQTQ